MRRLETLAAELEIDLEDIVEGALVREAGSLEEDTAEYQPGPVRQALEERSAKVRDVLSEAEELINSAEGGSREWRRAGSEWVQTYAALLVELV